MPKHQKTVDYTEGDESPPPPPRQRVLTSPDGSVMAPRHARPSSFRNTVSEPRNTRGRSLTHKGAKRQSQTSQPRTKRRKSQQTHSHAAHLQSTQPDPGLPSDNFAELIAAATTLSQSLNEAVSNLRSHQDTDDIQDITHVQECDTPIHVQHTVPLTPLDETINPLEEAVNSLLSRGETNNLNSSMTFDLPLGITLTEKVKDKIVNGQYVNLRSIVFPQDENDDIQIELPVDGNCTNIRLVKGQTRKQNSQLSINQWNSAMHIYGAIYLPHHPNEIAQYFQYLEFIDKMARKSQGWYRYDETFRRAREFQKFSWDAVLVNPFISASLPNNTLNNFRNSRIANQNFSGTPVGYCFKYHRPNGSCNVGKCYFSHKCPKCGGLHPSSKCKTKSNMESGQYHKI